MSSKSSIDFDGIYLQGKGHKNPGKIKFISNGLGWKETITGVVITIKSEDILSMAWSRVSRDYQLQIVLKEASSGSSNTSSYSFDGFPKEVNMKWFINCLGSRPNKGLYPSKLLWNVS